MDRLFLAIARRFHPELAESTGRARAVGFADVLAILYAGPLTIVALVWLVAATDLSVLAVAWMPLAVVFALIYVFRRLDFTFYSEIEPGLFGTFGGSVDDIVRWSATLLFGPTVLWLQVFWRTAGLVRGLRRSDVPELRWGSVRQFLVDVGGDTFAGLAGLALYVRIGGVHPPSALTFSALVPAVFATLVRFIIPVIVSAPYLSYIARSPELDLGVESRRNLLRFSVVSSSWPLLLAPFSVFAAGLFAEKGLAAYSILALGAVFASALTHKMSKAVELSRGRRRELQSIEALSRAIMAGPPDASNLAELLEEHAANMFVMSTIDIRLFPQTDLLHAPGYADAPDEVMWEWLQATGETLASPAGRELPWGDVPRSFGVLLVPISDSETGATIGGLALRKRLSPEDVNDVLPAAQSLAGQIASALHGAEVYRQALENARAEEELTVAAEMQASLMPAAAPRVPGWEFKALIDSAREASGDFIDLIPLTEGKWGIVIADVSGKGIAAALYMAMVRTLLRTYAVEHEGQPDRVMREVNRRILSDTTNDSFVTAFYGVLDPARGTLLYCNAGHNPPFLFRRSNGGAVDELRGTGIPLGMVDDARWQAGEVTMDPGDRLLAYTDGVTDAQNESEEPFGERRLLEVAKANVDNTPIEMRTAVFDEVKNFVGGAPQEDDITLMVVSRADRGLPAAP